MESQVGPQAYPEDESECLSTLGATITDPHFLLDWLSIAKALLPILKVEQKHMSTNEIVQQQRETDVRVTCGILYLS